MKFYDDAYLIIDCKIPILRTGDFYYKPYQNNFLIDVVIETYGDTTYIYGKKLTFVMHEPNETMFGINVEEHVNKFCISPSDWYDYTPTRLERLFGEKPSQKLKEKNYRMKNIDEKLFIIKGGFIHEHI